MLKKQTHFTLSGTLLLIVVFGSFLEVFHYSLVPHHFCPHTGGWIHEDEIGEPKSQKESDEWVVRGQVPREFELDSCLVYVHQQNWKKTFLAGIQAAPSPIASDLTIGLVRSSCPGKVSISQLTLAPKNSPPAV